LEPKCCASGGAHHFVHPLPCGQCILQYALLQQLPTTTTPLLSAPCPALLSHTAQHFMQTLKFYILNRTRRHQLPYATIIRRCPSAQILEILNRRLLHALPLHHIHGAVVAMHTPHSAGACVEFLPKFSPTSVWDRLMVGLPSSHCTLTDMEPLADTHSCGYLSPLHIHWAGAAC
jgi:hypothetical protein